jgi:predicted secreted hydrolase
VSRRTNPENVYIADRMATAARLGAADISPETVELWLDAWEAHARVNNLDQRASDFWSEGEVWIKGERAVQRLPGQDPT